MSDYDIVIVHQFSEGAVFSLSYANCSIWFGHLLSLCLLCPVIGGRDKVIEISITVQNSPHGHV